jgi:hypothetical protein
MDKQSIIELQKIDCNCNDCIFMNRNIERFKQSLNDHHRWQLNYFNTVKNNLLKKADWWQNPRNPKFNYEKGINLKLQAEKMKFQFDKSTCLINYGFCMSEESEKFNITFIPNTLQLNTQHCFKHRRD